MFLYICIYIYISILHHLGVCGVNEVCQAWAQAGTVPRRLKIQGGGELAKRYPKNIQRIMCQYWFLVIQVSSFHWYAQYVLIEPWYFSTLWQTAAGNSSTGMGTAPGIWNDILVAPLLHRCGTVVIDKHTQAVSTLQCRPWFRWCLETFGASAVFPKPWRISRCPWCGSLTSCLEGTLRGQCEHCSGGRAPPPTFEGTDSISILPLGNKWKRKELTLHH